jgi:hypothetical protein
MASITAITGDFFAACETGGGKPAGLTALQMRIRRTSRTACWHKTLRNTRIDEGINDDYADGSYEMKSLLLIPATQRRCLRCLFRVLIPVRVVRASRPQKTTSDYVYVMQFTGDKISHYEKIGILEWH